MWNRRMAALSVVLVASAGCSGVVDQRADTAGSSAPAVTTSGAPTAVSGGGVVTFDGDGIMVRRANDVAKLAGTPDDFRQYIAGRIDEVRPSGQPNPDPDCPEPSVRVDAYDPKGFAAGGVHSFCEGVAVLWKKDDGIWQEIVASQMGWPCDVLVDHAVPASVAGDECLEGNADGTAETVTYGPQ